MKLIGNSSHIIDWSALVAVLKTQTGRSRGSKQEDDIHHNPKVAELRKTWIDAGYEDDESVGWLDYDVPTGVVENISNWLNITPIGGWITSVPPGYCVPWHYDITDDEEDILAKGTPIRFTCHIDKPQWGQVFVLGDHAFHMEEQGNFYQWADWQEWHGGMNMGLTPKFLFNLMGYAK